jgi:hypothetical protein
MASLSTKSNTTEQSNRIKANGKSNQFATESLSIYQIANEQDHIKDLSLCLLGCTNISTL